MKYQVTITQDKSVIFQQVVDDLNIKKVVKAVNGVSYHLSESGSNKISKIQKKRWEEFRSKSSQES